MAHSKIEEPIASPVIEQKKREKTETQVKKWNDVNKNNEINKLKNCIYTERKRKSERNLFLLFELFIMPYNWRRQAASTFGIKRKRMRKSHIYLRCPHSVENFIKEITILMVLFLSPRQNIAHNKIWNLKFPKSTIFPKHTTSRAECSRHEKFILKRFEFGFKGIIIVILAQ